MAFRAGIARWNMIFLAIEGVVKNTILIILANQKRNQQNSEPIRTRPQKKYVWLVVEQRLARENVACEQLALFVLF